MCKEGKHMMEEIIPYEFKENYDKITIDKMFNSYWIVKGFLGDVHIFEGIDKLLNCPNTFFSTHITRAKSGDYLKKLTSVISHTNSEKKDGITEQIDIDVLNKITEEAKMLRHLVQVENEEIYEVCILIGIVGKNEEEVRENVKAVENIAYTNGFYIVPANFRQKQVYFLTLPLRKVEDKLKVITQNIFTTSSLASLFPFYSTKFIQEDGICVGKSSNTTCLIDFRSEYNNNKNILVFGSSGAGKSYYIKLMVLQYLYLGLEQVIIDPEGEYTKLAKSLHQRVITSNNYNMLEIEEGFVNCHPTDFLDIKIQQICKLLQVEEVVQDVTKVKMIQELLKEIYNEYSITNDRNSLYRYSNNENVFSSKKYINYNQFPRIQELKKKLSSIKLKTEEKKVILNNIGKFETNQEEINECFEQAVVVYDVSKKDDLFLKFVIEKMQEYCTPNVYIYIDEMWQIITSGIAGIDNKFTDMFKTIRKSGAGIVAITQDITDVLAYNNGDFGKSILNNAFTKVYFKMEYLDIDNLKKLIVDKNNIMEKIKQLKRGFAIVDYGGNIFELQVLASNYENRLIEGDIYEENTNCNGK